MIKLFSLFIMLLIAICSTNLQAQVQERAANQQDFEATKNYYESIINQNDSKHKETNNWINRWLWQNRDGYLPNPTNDDFGRNANGKTNQTQAQKGWSPLGPVSFPPSFDAFSGHGMGRVNCIHSTQRIRI